MLKQPRAKTYQDVATIRVAVTKHNAIACGLEARISISSMLFVPQQHSLSVVWSNRLPEGVLWLGCGVWWRQYNEFEKVENRKNV